MRWDAKKTAEFRRLLLAWYGRNRRELPWRLDPTPYHVWVSEIMLQQTRVSTVIPYYFRFLERFPDLQSLAVAPEADVLALWTGLGYYSRARNMIRAARIIFSRYGGVFPNALEDIRDLPGVGRYTAGAIYSIAYDRPEPVVDGNVRRVMERIGRIERRRPDAFYWETAASLMARRRPSDFNQAMMELGALVCTPSAPRCDSCPVYELCQSREALKIRGRLKKVGRTVHIVILVASWKGKILICPQVPAGFIPGSWFLPTGVVQKGESVRETATRMTGDGPAVSNVGQVRHVITSRRIVANIYAVNGRIRMAGGRWIEESQVRKYLLSSLYIKACVRAQSRSHPQDGTGFV